MVKLPDHYCAISIHAPPRRSATSSLIIPWLNSITISIHAPPRRSATHCLQNMLNRQVISIHAPPRRSATPVHRLVSLHYRISIHAPPRRSATYPDQSRLSVPIVFQSTHPREGVRLVRGSDTVHLRLISIHAPPRRSATLISPPVGCV